MCAATLSSYPRRVVCLTAETAEIAFRVGAESQVVGVSGFAVRPKEVRNKPRIGGYTGIKIEKVLALEPDLVLAYSDLQADIVHDLVKSGVPVLATSQTTISEIRDAILLIARVLGRESEGLVLLNEFDQACETISKSARSLPYRPKVFFEEWNDPIITGIGWVGDMIEIAGGENVFADVSNSKHAKDRILNDSDVIEKNPDVIIASWCGKKVQAETILSRDGWENIPAVKNKEVHEIKSPYILQPGPAVLEGLEQMHSIIASVATKNA